MDSHPAHPAPPKLSMRGISKAYPGVQALQDVDLDLESGQILGLVGENGAGKSTMCDVISGLTQPATGSVFFDGSDISCLTRYQKILQRDSYNCKNLFNFT